MYVGDHSGVVGRVEELMYRLQRARVSLLIA